MPPEMAGGTEVATTLRPAVASDAGLLRTCFELASEGLAQHFWAQSREPGQTVDDVAEARMQMRIADPGISVLIAGEGQGAVVSYDIGPEPEPLDDLVPLIRPLVALENRAGGTHYINVLAVLPGHRRKGVGRSLIGGARKEAKGRPLSLIVSDANAGARALYEAAGFHAVAREPQVSDGWTATGKDWILMVTGR